MYDFLCGVVKISQTTGKMSIMFCNFAQTMKISMITMNEYMIYTLQGFTQSPTNEQVENCQILGFVEADDAEQARLMLIKENPEITKRGFNIDETFVRMVSKVL